MTNRITEEDRHEPENDNDDGKRRNDDDPPRRDEPSPNRVRPRPDSGGEGSNSDEGELAGDNFVEPD